MSLKHYALVAAVIAPLAMSGLGTSSVAAQAAPTPDDKVAALKKSLAENAAKLRGYEWIETTIISLKGEEKSRKQQRAYYGADGKVQKVAVGGAAPAAAAPDSQGGGGRRGGRAKAAAKENIVENKKEEMADYMEQAVALVHQYVPPAPEQIQKAKDAGTLKMGPAAAGVVRVEIADYLLPGDKLTIDVNAATNSLANVNVASYLDKKDDAVTLDVKFAALPDGTSYSQQTTFVAKAKNIQVVVQNSGHRPVQK